MGQRKEAPVLYRMLRAISKSSLSIFFQKIEIRHGENIPAAGPAVFAANHPSSTMDGIIMSAVTSRLVHHIAHAGLFSHRTKAWLLRNCGVIPVHYRRNKADKVERNIDAFQACFEILERGGAVSIFPEGISDMPRHIQKLKTGAARIVLEAERRNGYRLGVELVPVGLHFFSRSRFRSRALVNIGRPIDLKPYFPFNEKDNSEAVRKLTEEIQDQLERLTVNVRFTELEQLVADIESLYMDELLSEVSEARNISRPAIAQFVISQRIAECVEYYYHENPRLVREMQEKIVLYKRKLKRLRLKDSMVQEKSGLGRFFKSEFTTIIKALIGLPLALYGILNNFVPYRITEAIARKYIEERTKILFALFLGGGLTFAAFYGIQVVLMWQLKGLIWAILYLISLPLSGFFALAYTKAIRREKQRISFSFLFFTKRHLIGKMRYARKKLISELDAIKDEYLKLEQTPK
jgi:glycerol-3-phosphate O-acyltransferase/dihydroxyacetone phosphate acyltransferase